MKGGPQHGHVIVLGGALPTGTVLGFRVGDRAIADYVLSDRKYRNRRVADWIATVAANPRAKRG